MLFFTFLKKYMLIFLLLLLLFLEFQLMASTPNDSSLSSDLDTN